jgi:hypothetical protein
MIPFTFPPWSVGADEIVCSPLSEFAACKQVIFSFEAKMGGTVTKETCSVSDQWGRVVRGKCSFYQDGHAVEAFITSWDCSGKGVQVVVKMAD